MADGIARAGFDMDLAHGEARESAFVQALTRCHVEHKCDNDAPSTGNVFVEFEQKGRPSGIATTTADWWAIEVQGDTWIVVRTSVLRRAVERVKGIGRVVMGGDHNLYRGALVPVEWLYRGIPPITGAGRDAA